jgi:hypothetical protein
VLVVQVALGALAAWVSEVLVVLGALAVWVLEVLVEPAATLARGHQMTAH